MPSIYTAISTSVATTHMGHQRCCRSSLRLPSQQGSAATRISSPYPLPHPTPTPNTSLANRSMFLMGPWKQIKTMFDSKRALSTIIYIVAIGAWAGGGRGGAVVGGVVCNALGGIWVARLGG